MIRHQMLQHIKRILLEKIPFLDKIKSAGGQINKAIKRAQGEISITFPQCLQRPPSSFFCALVKRSEVTRPCAMTRCRSNPSYVQNLSRQRLHANGAP